MRQGALLAIVASLSGSTAFHLHLRAPPPLRVSPPCAHLVRVTETTVSAASQRRSLPPLLLAPGPLSLLPPVTTLVAAIALRSTFVAMLFGIWTGTLLLSGGNPLVALLRTFDGYVVSA